MTVLVGCSKKEIDLSQATVSTTGIKTDGTIEEVVVESFEENYYSLDELQAYIESAVADFNKQHSGEQEAVTFQSVDLIEVENVNSARMLLDYASDECYDAFNDTSLQFMSVDEAAAMTSVTEISDFVSVKKNENVSFEDFSNSKNLHVICTESAMRIQTEGKIMYYNTGVSLINDQTAVTSDGFSVIVFK
jgi:hypothetical protein